MATSEATKVSLFSQFNLFPNDSDNSNWSSARVIKQEKISALSLALNNEMSVAGRLKTTKAIEQTKIQLQKIQHKEKKTNALRCFEKLSQDCLAHICLFFWKYSKEHYALLQLSRGFNAFVSQVKFDAIALPSKKTFRKFKDCIPLFKHVLINHTCSNENALSIDAHTLIVINKQLTGLKLKGTVNLKVIVIHEQVSHIAPQLHCHLIEKFLISIEGANLMARIEDLIIIHIAATKQTRKKNASAAVMFFAKSKKQFGLARGYLNTLQDMGIVSTVLEAKPRVKWFPFCTSKDMACLQIQLQKKSSALKITHNESTMLRKSLVKLSSSFDYQGALNFVRSLHGLPCAPGDKNSVVIELLKAYKN